MSDGGGTESAICARSRNRSFHITTEDIQLTDNPHASDATPEVIDSSQMQVLAEFEYADEFVDNADRFRVGVLNLEFWL